MSHRFVVMTAAALLTSAAPLAAQRHRGWVEFGAGSLGPDDPFAATLSLRAAAGWMLDGRNAIGLEYSRQSANGSEGDDLGKFARQFIGLTWQHAFRNVFADQGAMRQQYLFRVSGGALVRGTFPEAVGDQRLATAPFVDIGLVIRYPFSSRVSAVGTVEDAVGFLPHQRVRSYCGQVNGFSTCYPRGGPDYVVVDLARKTQHNFGIFAMLQLRP
jgi:hypothetical protein